MALFLAAELGVWIRFSNDVIEQRHEAEVHVQLLVAVEEGCARIVGDEVDFDFLVAADHDDVFHQAGGGQSGVARDFKSVPVQVDGVDVVAGVAQAQAIALAFFQVMGCGRHHPAYGVRLPIDCPEIEAFEGGIVFLE